MGSSSSPPDLGREEFRKQKKGPPFKFLVPLVYAPILPLIRIGMRKNPVVRDRLFGVVLAAAFAHGLYLVTDQYDIESKCLTGTPGSDEVPVGGIPTYAFSIGESWVWMVLFMFDALFITAN